MAINKRYKIKAPVEKVWEALTDPKEIENWGGGPADMDSEPGSKFSLWGGDIYGENIEVVLNKKLVQEWYGGPWKKPSRVTFEIGDEDGHTVVEILQTDVPESEEADFDAGWDEYYMGALKEYLER